MLTIISHIYSHTPTFTKLGEITDADKAMEAQHFGRDAADIRVWIRINPEIRIEIPDDVRLTSWPWRSLRFLGAGKTVTLIRACAWLAARLSGHK